ncbi:MAG: hypothetical protein HY297_03290 [Thaumarchaeota archaeon]|nr:hypothetical protein [Nitrososphaerota archaeon]
MIASLSGIRGTLNVDMTLVDVASFAANFGELCGPGQVLLARDTRSTGPAMSRAVAGALMARGCRVLDYGVISTPALFRESRMKKSPAVMVTASHNEPEFNGLKFLVDGVGIGEAQFQAVMGAGAAAGGFGPGSTRTAQRPTYVEDLVRRFGEGAFDGIKLALDLGGGAATAHSVSLLRRLGCEVVSVNDAPGVFTRTVDPVADELPLLTTLVREEGCDIGLGFDCDGDRLVIVDSRGRKRTGDYMLTLALSELLTESREKKVVVSMDTTQAVDDVVARVKGEVFRAKVGEANVVGMMNEKEARFGGEGSSGGLIDGDFNHCRDSMLAALVIIRALRGKGRKAYDSVPVYHQERVAVVIPRTKAQRALKLLAKQNRGADMTDGVKVQVSRRSWVLARPSGTEDKVRVSAEAETAGRAAQLAKAFASKVKGLSR